MSRKFKNKTTKINTKWIISIVSLKTFIVSIEEKEVIKLMSVALLSNNENEKKMIIFDLNLRKNLHNSNSKLISHSKYSKNVYST